MNVKNNTNKKSDNYYTQVTTFASLKKQEGINWLKEVNSQTLQFALRSLDTSYLNFFRGNTEFRCFKSRKHKNNFTIPQSIKIEYSKIVLRPVVHYYNVK